VHSLPWSNVEDSHAVLNVATNAKMIVQLDICGPVCFQSLDSPLSANGRIGMLQRQIVRVVNASSACNCETVAWPAGPNLCKFVTLFAYWRYYRD